MDCRGCAKGGGVPYLLLFQIASGLFVGIESEPRRLLYRNYWLYGSSHIILANGLSSRRVLCMDIARLPHIKVCYSFRTNSTFSNDATVSTRLTTKECGTNRHRQTRGDVSRRGIVCSRDCVCTPRETGDIQTRVLSDELRRSSKLVVTFGIAL